MKPITQPITGKITSPFGNRIHPITKVKTFHNGVDISAVIGTKVVAPWSGGIVKCDTKPEESMDIGGWELRIKHDNGYTTGYAHLNKIHVTAGQQVTAGQHIADTGNSGIGTGPHLHFTLRDAKGSLINPLTIFTF